MFVIFGCVVSCIKFAFTFNMKFLDESRHYNKLRRRANNETKLKKKNCENKANTHFLINENNVQFIQNGNLTWIRTKISKFLN